MPDQDLFLTATTPHGVKFHPRRQREARFTTQNTLEISRPCSLQTGDRHERSRTAREGHRQTGDRHYWPRTTEAALEKLWTGIGVRGHGRRESDVAGHERQEKSTRNSVRIF